MKAIIIEFQGKPVMALTVKENLDSLEFLKLKKECDKNFAELEKEKKEKLKAIEDTFAKLEHEIKILKGEE